MSIIAFKITEHKVQVAADGRTLSGDKICRENAKKIKKISDSLIIGITGMADSNGIFEKFALENQDDFETLSNETDGLVLMKKFRDFLKENFGYEDNSIKELGGFLIANKHFLCVYYFSGDCLPYSGLCESDVKSGSFGSSSEYTTALIDYGIDIEDAIKISAKKYTSINDNVTILEIER